MWRYIVRRLLTAIPVIVLVSVLTFVGQQLIPGDPLLAILGANEVEVLEADPAALEALRQEYGLDQPVLVQYARYAWRCLQGDFGRSFRTRKPVLEAIGERLRVTLTLSTVTFFVTIMISVPLGIVAALHRGTKIDLFATTWAVLGVATPGFWVAILLIIVFSVNLGWLPAAGWVDPFEDPVEGIKHMILPVVALGLFGSATIMRQTRSALLEVLRQDYITTARAKGLAGRRVILRHALKNAMIPVVTLLALSLAALLGGTVLIERVFAIPGVGRLALDATNGRDYPVIQAIVLMSAIAIVLANLIADLAYGFLDPRIRYR
jgi:peptide/nickel transport system permease protein